MESRRSTPPGPRNWLARLWRILKRVASGDDAICAVGAELRARCPECRDTENRMLYGTSLFWRVIDFPVDGQARSGARAFPAELLLSVILGVRRQNLLDKLAMDLREDLVHLS